MPPYKHRQTAGPPTPHQPANDLRCSVCRARNTQCMPSAASMNFRVGCIPPPSLLRFTIRFAIAAAAAVNAMNMTGITLVVSLSSYEMWEPPCCVNDADSCAFRVTNSGVLLLCVGSWGWGWGWRWIRRK